MPFFYLALGILGLWIGAELAIRASIELSDRFKISRVFFGLTILAFGTDLPEFVVGINAAIQRLQGVETSGLVLGETLGTVMSQMGLMMGVAGFLGVTVIRKKLLLRDGIVMCTSILLLFLFALNGTLSRPEGLVMIILYGLYLLLLVREEGFVKKVRTATHVNIGWSIVSIIGGFILLIWASSLTISTALEISIQLGVSTSIIGALLVGMGTSLPELATTLSAFRRKSAEMAVSGLIGSNIIDILLTTGVATTISTFVVEKRLLMFDFPYLFIASLVILTMLYSRAKLSKREALICAGLYGAYYVSLILFAIQG